MLSGATHKALPKSSYSTYHLLSVRLYATLLRTLFAVFVWLRQDLGAVIVVVEVGLGGEGWEWP